MNLPVVEVFEDFEDLETSALLDFQLLYLKRYVLHEVSEFGESFDVLGHLFDLGLDDLV